MRPGSVERIGILTGTWTWTWLQLGQLQDKRRGNGPKGTLWNLPEHSLGIIVLEGRRCWHAGQLGMLRVVAVLSGALADLKRMVVRRIKHNVIRNLLRKNASLPGRELFILLSFIGADD